MELVLIKVALLSLIFFITAAIACVESLLVEVIYLGLTSLLLTLLYMVMNATDVAITENAVGSYVSTIFILWVGLVIGKRDVRYPKNAPLALVLSILAGCVLLYITCDLPIYGSPDGAANNEVCRYYLENTEPLFGFPNAVTAILAGFRGYDTLIETVVVFTAALSVFVLLGSITRNDKR